MHLSGTSAGEGEQGLVATGTEYTETQWILIGLEDVQLSRVLLEGEHLDNSLQHNYDAIPA